MIHTIEKALCQLRQEKPLILNLTNLVTMDFIANCLLALGASPIMSICEAEIEELVCMSSAIYINMGTVNAAFISLSEKAIQFSEKYNKPIVLDPVGAGATRIRTQTAKMIAPFANMIRGNASEILALGGEACETKGVDSTHQTDSAKESANRLACHYQSTIVVSGAIDFVTDGLRVSQVAQGSALMQKVTGMGCALTAVMAAFKAVVDDPFEAGLVSAYYFALCGEVAALHHNNLGSFKSAFLDQLHNPDFECMKERLDKSTIL